MIKDFDRVKTGRARQSNASGMSKALFFLKLSPT
jgi:hypothetical protein